MEIHRDCQLQCAIDTVGLPVPEERGLTVLAPPTPISLMTTSPEPPMAFPSAREGEGDWEEEPPPVVLPPPVRACRSKFGNFGSKSDKCFDIWIKKCVHFAKYLILSPLFATLFVVVIKIKLES